MCNGPYGDRLVRGLRAIPVAPQHRLG
jgi:hypothetical protein